jgi:NAD(P)H-flavin reductase
MTLPAESSRDLLCVAGGTGLAPIKAIVEQAAAAGRPAITLLFGARTRVGLYDLRALRRLAAVYPPLELVTAVSQQPGLDGRQVDLPGLVRERNEWNDREVYVCGPSAMVRETQAVLGELGVPADRVHYDEPDPPAPPAADGGADQADELCGAV